MHSEPKRTERYQTIRSSRPSNLGCRGQTCPKCNQCRDWKYHGDGVYVGRGIIPSSGIYGDYVKRDGATCIRVGVDPLGASLGDSITADTVDGRGGVYHGSNILCKCKDECQDKDAETTAVASQPKVDHNKDATIFSNENSAESVAITTNLLSSPPKYRNTKLEQLIDQNKNESSLHLNDKQLTDEDMEIVAYYLLRNNTTLNALWLTNNQIGDKGAQYIAEALRQNTKLDSFWLRENQIGDKGAQYIAEALENNGTTRISLWLTNNPIGAQGAKYLERLQAKNRRITLFWDRN